jgi:hypothetical protein
MHNKHIKYFLNFPKGCMDFKKLIGRIAKIAAAKNRVPYRFPI